MRYTRETLTFVAAGMMATVMAAPVGQSHRDAMQAKDKKPPQEVREHVNQWEGIDHAVAVVRPTKGNSVKGTVWFTQTKKGVRVEAKIRGLDPQSKHAFHIHKYGDATAADATSAGGHYDPDDTGHHARSNADVAHHAGDLGNLQTDSSGHAHYTRVIEGISVADLHNPIVGRGIVVHARADQFDQPTGSAGARIGFGVIGVANPALIKDKAKAGTES